MKISLNWLKDYVKINITPEQLANQIAMKFAEVEGVEKTANDVVFDLNITPNRPDCFSHLGVAGEIAAILGTKLNVPNRLVKEVGGKTLEYISVKVEDKKSCPLYSARVIKNVKVGPSPKWLAERLEVCGVRSINNIVDITNYVMLETSQPLHAFDSTRISANKNTNQREIIVRKAKQGEKIKTLDGAMRKLSSDVLVIADVKGPIAIAGIMGGAESEVSNQTKDIILESANFNWRGIRKTQRAIGLKTESSTRFEKNSDPNEAVFSLDRAAKLISEISGGEVLAGKIVVDNLEKEKKALIKISKQEIEKTIGVSISNQEIKKVLESLGFQVSQKANEFMVTPPSFRRDVKGSEDIVEEVARMFGYDKIPVTLPASGPSPIPDSETLKVEKVAKQVLVGAGFSEVYNYTMIGKKLAGDTNVGLERAPKLFNFLSPDREYLRPSLVPTMLESVALNLRFFDSFGLFEIATVFEKASGNNKLPFEKKRLCGVVVGKGESMAFVKDAREFFQAKGAVWSLLKEFGIDNNIELKEVSNVSFLHPGRGAEILVNNKSVGIIGEVAPQVLGNLKIKKRIGLFDLDFDLLALKMNLVKKYQLISKYPAVKLDLAIVVPDSVRVLDVKKSIAKSSGQIVNKIELFDIFRGSQIGVGKKSLAFAITFQSNSKTLTDKEIEKTLKEIISNLEKEHNAKVRD